MRLSLARVLALALAAALVVPIATLAQEPRMGGTVVQAISADPPTMNPATTTDTQAWSLMGKLFNGLTYLDNDYRSHPDLAESWTISPDGLTYTFKLRKDVKWHDGKPFTSADVKWTYQEAIAKYHPVGRVAYASIASIDTPDPYTVVLKMKTPFGPTVFMTSLNMGPILPKHLLEGQDLATAEFNRKPVGTGPFKIAEAVKGSHYVLERNPDYFKKGRPYLDRVILKVMPNPASRVLAFEKGEVDVLYSFFLPREQAGRVKALPGIVVKEYMLFPETILLFFNLKDNKALGDVRVRQAIFHGIDQSFLVQQGYAGQGRPGTSVIPSSLAWAYNANVPKYPFDVAKAGALFDEAGYPKNAQGERMALRLVYDPANSAANRASEVVAQQLKGVGLNVKLVPLERSLMLEKVFKQYDFDLYIHNYTSYGDPALGIGRIYTCDNIRPAPFVNVERYCNPKVDELFAKGGAVASQAERAKPYREVQEILMKDLPTIPLVEYGDTNVARARVQNIFKSLSSHERWDEVWVTDGK
ncbi:MAG TPA: ABC transporter substrate-binding protein [Methylomirabilota bacterium]|nr:ABC transporter substrate-binding protein [Methylomirabilota bacterium]